MVLCSPWLFSSPPRSAATSAPPVAILSSLLKSKPGPCSSALSPAFLEPPSWLKENISFPLPLPHVKVKYIQRFLPDFTHGELEISGRCGRYLV